MTNQLEVFLSKIKHYRSAGVLKSMLSLDVFSKLEQHYVGTKIFSKCPKAKKAEMSKLRLYEKLHSVMLISIL